MPSCPYDGPFPESKSSFPWWIISIVILILIYYASNAKK
jgi:hypothetical protein